MAKVGKSVRLSEIAVAKLAAVAKQRGISESLVIEQLIMGLGSADNDQGSVATARARLQGLPLMSVIIDPKEAAGPVTVDNVIDPDHPKWRDLADCLTRPNQSLSRLLEKGKPAPSGRVDPEKIAAFQEKAGMTKWGKKRGQG